MDQGGSIKIGRQIFPDFVQVQTVFFIVHEIRAVCLKFKINFISRYRLHVICGLDYLTNGETGMPYYLYKISSLDGIDLVKNLQLLEVFDSFRDAKKNAKSLRQKENSDEFNFKVMFAENQLSAEEQLLEKREKPVLMEYER
jgi:hypothetical protein